MTSYRLVKGGRLTAGANAWGLDVPWGASTTARGETVSWGVKCSGTDCTSGDSWRVGQGSTKNVVWGSECGGADCVTVWTLALVAAADGGETVVWGTDGGETVVWGTDDGETVVWGTDGGETVVWGTSCRDSSCTPVIWGRR